MEPDELPISLVCHTAFCPRRTWLEAVGDDVDSFAIQAGQTAHSRVDDARSSRPLALRSVEIGHTGLHLSGRCDVLEGELGCGVEIVEYKSTPVRRRPEVTPAQVTQLALQRLCLTDMGITVLGQSIYFVNHQVRQPVHIGEKEISDAMTWVEHTRRVVASTDAPEPLEDDARCNGCSHAEVCLPDEHHARQKSRSISVVNPDSEVLHLLTQGSRASLRSGRVRVVKGDDELASIPFERVLGIVAHGNVDLSAALIRECLWNRATLVWCSSRGRVTGWAHSAASPAGLTRSLQHYRSVVGDLPIAREILATKVSNQGTQIRRNGIDCDDSVRSIRAIAKEIRTAQSIDDLVGLEGQAAASYFERFADLIRPSGIWAYRQWPGRRGRLATDPLNSMLNFAYGLLLADCIRALVACGLDPSAGFIHSSTRNKPALGLDLMEEFRAPIADSVVLGALNNRELRPEMIKTVAGSSRLLTSGTRALATAYERRLQTEIKHPLFGYRATWRRCIEVQARLLRGTLDGSQPRYTGMRTR